MAPMGHVANLYAIEQKALPHENIAQPRDNEIIVEPIDAQPRKSQSEPQNNIVIFEFSDEVDDILQQYQTRQAFIRYDDFTRYNLSIAKAHSESALNKRPPIPSVILQPGYDGLGYDGHGYDRNEKNFHQCANLPLAIIIDIDNPMKNGLNNASIETPKSIANNLSDQLAKALTPLRDANIAIIWLSDQPKEEEEKAGAYLQNIGLADQRDLLAFKNNDNKQQRRQYIASRYCIISILGDEKPDFDELFAYLRNPDQFTALGPMFDKGWFIRTLPNFDYRE